MNIGIVARLLAGFSLFFTLSLVVPLVVSLFERATISSTVPFVGAIGAGLLVSGGLWLAGRNSGPDLFRKEGLAVVGLAWFLAGGLASIPFLWSGAIPGFADAYFESISGLTTTGATVLGTNNVDIESLPRSLLLWRAMLQWMGGIGIVLVFIVLLPGSVGMTGSRLLSSEQVGMSDEAARPRLADQARRLFQLYVLLTLVAALAYWSVGLPLFDATCHAMTTLATGGFSNHNVSVGGYRNLGVELVAVTFMFIAGCNFLLVLRVLTRDPRPRPTLHVTEFKTYIGLVLAVALGITLSLWVWGEPLRDDSLGITHDYSSLARCLRDGVFQTVSILTSTGYANADFESLAQAGPLPGVRLHVRRRLHRIDRRRLQGAPLRHLREVGELRSPSLRPASRRAEAQGQRRGDPGTGGLAGGRPARAVACVGRGRDLRPGPRPAPRHAVGVHRQRQHDGLHRPRVRRGRAGRSRHLRGRWQHRSRSVLRLRGAPPRGEAVHGRADGPRSARGPGAVGAPDAAILETLSAPRRRLAGAARSAHDSGVSTRYARGSVRAAASMVALPTAAVLAAARSAALRTAALLSLSVPSVAQVLGSESAEPRWWPDAVESQVLRAGENLDQIRAALTSVTVEQRPGMAFLVRHMPERDLVSLEASFLLDEVATAYAARAAAKWSVPDAVFFEAVLPYAHTTEKRESWRPWMRERFAPLVADAPTPGEAAQILNREIFGELGVKYSTRRRRADQSPSESIEQGLASCTGLSILLADACRSVGVPARLAGIARWANKRGNHTWVEVWDGEWKFTGAAEYDARGLDRAWFVNDAALAISGSRSSGIYAFTWSDTGATFPLVWSRGEPQNAVEVTARYTRGRHAGPRDGYLWLMLDVVQGDRRVAAVIKARQDGAVAWQGLAKDEGADTNDHLTFEVPHGAAVRLEVAFDGHERIVEHVCRDRRQEIVVVPIETGRAVRVSRSAPEAGADSRDPEAALRDAATAYFAASPTARDRFEFPAGRGRSRRRAARSRSPHRVGGVPRGRDARGGAGAVRAPRRRHRRSRKPIHGQGRRRAAGGRLAARDRDARWRRRAEASQRLAVASHADLLS